MQRRVRLGRPTFAWPTNASSWRRSGCVRVRGSYATLGSCPCFRGRSRTKNVVSKFPRRRRGGTGFVGRSTSWCTDAMPAIRRQSPISSRTCSSSPPRSPRLPAAAVNHWHAALQAATILTPDPALPRREILDTHRKALAVNLDERRYGTFAEIGAGQEVARWFFRVGGAAGTIAKAMSAYDMAFSDAIYGVSERYVSKQRINAMLDHEFRLLYERLDARRGDKTRFFVFADTVAAKSFNGKNDPHGWLGIRFQSAPRTDPS